MKKRLVILIAALMIASIMSVSVYASLQEITYGQIGPVEIRGTLYTYEDFSSYSYAYGRTFLDPITGVQILSAYCKVTVFPYNEQNNPESTIEYYSNSSLITTSTVSVLNGKRAVSKHNAEVISNNVYSTLFEPLSIVVYY